MKKVGFVLFLMMVTFNAGALDLSKGAQDLNNNLQKIEVKKADKKAELEAKKAEAKEKIDAKKQEIKDKQNEIKNKVEAKKKAISDVKNSLQTTTSGCSCKNKKQ